MVTISATYSPEDNKIRLYPSARLDAETYARVKAAGFVWAPKQELFVSPKWTPEREDLATELAGEIEPEEMTIAERAQLKAERLEGIAHKRIKEANAFNAAAEELSQAFYMGQPILVGHHSERKARKTQERMHSAMDKAVKTSKAANYWLYRAEGVEAFANMKNDPRTRANRIKTLLAELRDLQRGINRGFRALELWEKLTTDAQIQKALGYIPAEETAAHFGLYSAVERGEMTAQDARAKCIENAQALVNGPKRRRWIDHVLNRLAYERSMQGSVPRYEGELTPLMLQAFAREHGAEKPKCSVVDDGYFLLESPVPLPAHISSEKWLELSGDDWRDLMQSCGYIVPEPVERRKSSKPAPAPLINLTKEQAEQLQRIWNLYMIAACQTGQTPKENKVREMTQAVFSNNSKGDYAPLQTVEIDAEGRRVRGTWRNYQFVKSAEPVARVRIATNGATYYMPDALIHLTDKPAKPLPIDLDAIEAAAREAVAKKSAAA